MAAQAVGGAVKRKSGYHHRACHRVVGSGRAFGGYGGRLDIKAELLELEAWIWRASICRTFDGPAVRLVKRIEVVNLRAGDGA